MGIDILGTCRTTHTMAMGNFISAMGPSLKPRFSQSLGNFPDNGLMVYANGDEWTGRVDENGRRQGYGIMSWVNGDQFSGTYLDDKRHGRVWTSSSCVRKRVLRYG
uniref:Uncharacterized protein n=1 Tax=Spongospora subterranea TaxID=70186 RepID=A0A0H5QYH3_9EUKA|eukprot:CRZ07033.1 hypothetical protein [Spongospora subterranea]